MDFTELYAQKKMTAAQAAALVKSGDWVHYGWEHPCGGGCRDRKASA